MADNTIELRITALDEASAVINRLSSSLSTLASAYISFEGFKRFAENISESQRALMEFNHAFETFGSHVGVTKQNMLDFADTALRTTTLSRDAVLRGEAELLKFGSVTGQTFEDARKIMLSMASSTGDVESAARRLGLVLENPLAGFRLLREVGITFNRQQQENIRLLIEQGRQAEVTAYFIELYKQRLLDAGAAAQTPSGALLQLKNRIAEVFSGEGAEKETKGLVDQLHKLGDVFESPGMKKGLQEFAASIVQIIGAAVTGLSWIFSWIGRIAGAAERLMALRGRDAAAPTLADALNKTPEEQKRANELSAALRIKAGIEKMPERTEDERNAKQALLADILERILKLRQADNDALHQQLDVLDKIDAKEEKKAKTDPKLGQAAFADILTGGKGFAPQLGMAQMGIGGYDVGLIKTMDSWERSARDKIATFDESTMTAAEKPVAAYLKRVADIKMNPLINGKEQSKRLADAFDEMQAATMTGSEKLVYTYRKAVEAINTLPISKEKKDKRIAEAFDVMEQETATGAEKVVYQFDQMVEKINATKGLSDIEKKLRIKEGFANAASAVLTEGQRLLVAYEQEMEQIRQLARDPNKQPFFNESKSKEQALDKVRQPILSGMDATISELHKKMQEIEELRKTVGVGAADRALDDAINTTLKNARNIGSELQDPLRKVEQEFLDMRLEIIRSNNAIEEAMKDPKRSATELQVLGQALEENKARLREWEGAYSRAMKETHESVTNIGVYTKHALDEIDHAFEGMFDHIDEGIQGMLKSFLDALKQMVVHAIASDIAEKLGLKGPPRTGVGAGPGGMATEGIWGAISGLFGGGGKKGGGGGGVLEEIKVPHQMLPDVLGSAGTVELTTAATTLATSGVGLNTAAVSLTAAATALTAAATALSGAAAGSAASGASGGLFGALGAALGLGGGGAAATGGMEFTPAMAVGMAGGGLVSGERPTWVGESGPELIVPASTSKVLNARQLAFLGASGNKSINPNSTGALHYAPVTNITGTGLSPEQLQVVLANRDAQNNRELMRMLDRNGYRMRV